MPAESTIISTLMPMCRWTSVFVVGLVLLGDGTGPRAHAVGVVGAHQPPGNGAPALADSTTLLFYTHPADKWENALPVGNGRLGAMVFGKTDEETIQLNEDTYWSGGPYSTTVTGGAQGAARDPEAALRRAS